MTPEFLHGEGGEGGRPAAPPASPSHPRQGSSSWVVPLAQLHSSSRNFPSHFQAVSLSCGSFPACRTCPVTVRTLRVISAEITRIYLSDVRRSSCVCGREDPMSPPLSFPFYSTIAYRKSISQQWHCLRGDGTLTFQ